MFTTFYNLNTHVHDFGINRKHVLRNAISVTYRTITRRCIPGIDLNQKHDHPFLIEPTAAADRAPPTLSFDTRSRSDEFLSERNVVLVHDVRQTKGVDTETSRPGGGGICTYVHCASEWRKIVSRTKNVCHRATRMIRVSRTRVIYTASLRSVWATLTLPVLRIPSLVFSKYSTTTINWCTTFVRMSFHTILY